MKKRSFKKEEKLKIIKEASENGINETLEKYGIYRASYYDWKKRFEQMGEDGFTHGMTPAQQKRIRELQAASCRKRTGKQTQRRFAKKEICLGEKKEIVTRYIFQGMKRDTGLSITGITKHQYYYRPTGQTRGRRPSEATFKGTYKKVVD